MKSISDQLQPSVCPARIFHEKQWKSELDHKGAPKYLLFAMDEEEREIDASARLSNLWAPGRVNLNLLLRKKLRPCQMTVPIRTFQQMCSASFVEAVCIALGINLAFLKCLPPHTGNQFKIVEMENKVILMCLHTSLFSSVKRDEQTLPTTCDVIMVVVSFSLQLSTLVLLAMLLLLAGDVERNPGPFRDQLNIATLTTELSSAKDKWHEIGVQLDIPLSELSAVEDKFSSVDRRLSEMLGYWLDGNTKTPTCWESILECLRASTVNKKGLADSLEKKYCQKPAATKVNGAPLSSTSVSTMEMNGQPTPETSQEKPVVPVESGTKRNSVQAYSETEKSLIEVNEDKIHGAFANLVRHILLTLESRDPSINVEDFRVFAVQLFPPGHCIPFAESISAIFEAISRNNLWNYRHYGPLVNVVNSYFKGDAQTHKMIESYKCEFSGFNATTKIVDYIAKCKRNALEDLTDRDICDPDEPLILSPDKFNKDYFKRLTVKLRVRVTNQTLEYVDEIWRSIADIFLLPSLTAFLDFVADGSLVISWLIPHMYALQIEASIVDAEQFFRAQKIVQVKLDDVIVYHYDLDEVKDQLLKACEEGNFDTAMEKLMELMDDEPDFDFSQFNDTPLGAAAKHGHIDLVRRMLRVKDIDINGTDKDGRTALMLASLNGKTDVVELLLNHDAHVNIQHKNGSTALMWASGKGRSEIVRLLLEHGAEVNLTNERGRTALFFAQKEQNLEIAELLLESGAETNPNKILLLRFCKEGNVDKVEQLLSKVTDLDYSKHALTPLTAAAKHGHTHVVQLLVQRCFDVDGRDKVTPVKNGLQKSTVVRFTV